MISGRAEILQPVRVPAAGEGGLESEVTPLAGKEAQAFEHDSASGDRGGLGPVGGEALRNGIGVDELAHHFGTIGYEVLTSLGKRFLRAYRGEA